MKRTLHILPLALLTLIPALLYANTISTTPDNLEIGTPSQADTIINRTGYALGYNEDHEQAEWVSYKITKHEVLNKALNRTDNFRTDPLIETGSASLSDYRGSGYDRGHLAPAADMHFSPLTMSESFYLSNMSPQEPHFNRGIWKKLEALVRTWAVNNEEIYVVTAGVLKGELKQSIGANEVTVPEYYYKVVLDYKEPEIKAIGLLLRNEKSSEPLISFACSVDEIEIITGLDFFSELPDEIEDELESQIDISQWSWSSKSYTHHKTNIHKQHPTKEPSANAQYWLNTGSGTRHNQSCKYFDNTSEGRLCGADEGKACGICGG